MTTKARWTLTYDSTGRMEISGELAGILAWKIVHRGFRIPSGSRSMVLNGEAVRLLKNGEIKRETKTQQ